MRQANILRIFIIIFCFNLPLLGQVDTTKCYIQKLNIKSGQKIKTISISLKSNTSELKFDTDSIINIAFFNNDSVTLKIRIDDFDLTIENLNTFLTYCGLTYQIEVLINNPKSCTQIIGLDGCSGEEWASNVNCPDNFNNETLINFVTIWTIGEINSDQKQYKILEH